MVARQRKSPLNIEVLKRVMGHADVSATQRCLKAHNETVMAAISRFDLARRPRIPLPPALPVPDTATPVAA